VQTTGCCPIVRASEQGDREVVTPWPEIHTNVHGVRVAKALGDFLILDALYASSGFGVAVTDEEVAQTRLEIAADDGILLSPEGAACVAAYRHALGDGRVDAGERAVVFNTAIGLRSEMPAPTRHLDATKPLMFAAL
jgi:threonine synthase